MMNFKNLKEIIGLAMVGEGVVGFFYPKRYSMFWKIGFGPIEQLKQKAVDNPEIMRVVFAAEAVLGLCLAKGQFENSNKNGIRAA
ncbi:MAG: hypothetical protein ACR2IH_04090 [Pyrinomonadaceae bacterium]